MERISTGIENLDEIINGGIPKGSTILLCGLPGTGKTIFANQMMFYNTQPEKKAIYFTTLAEPQVKVLRFQQEFSFFDKSIFQRDVIYHDLGSTLRQHGPQQVLIDIDNLLKKHEPNLIIIDTIKTLTDMIPSLTEFRQFMLDLSLRLTTWGCTSLLLAEYSEDEIEIRPESGIADGIIYLYGPDERKQQKRQLRILKMRGTGYSGGESFFEITKNGIMLYPRLNPIVSEQKYNQLNERISTGLDSLDSMMGGGIPRSTTTLVSGSSGTGKTLLALNFANTGLQAGEPTVFVSFEENPGQIINSAMGIGINLQSHISSGLLQILHISPIELDLDENVYRIQKLVKNTGARRLVLDSISSFEIGITDKIKYTNYIWALTDYFKTQGIAIILTHEICNFSIIPMTTKHGISFVADNIILLCYAEEGNEVKSYLRVLKMRGSRHSKCSRELLIAQEGLSLI